MQNPGRIIFATAKFCLLISGAAGLVYEIVWARYLALFLGHTSYAVVAVLVAFMGGLALGNVWFGARADRTPRPLALYAWLELGIGIYALAFPFYYELCHRAFVTLARGLQPGSAGLLALKFGFSLLTILLPTVLMGGTLPVLIKLVTRSLGELRERVSTLYFVNSAGAVAGCFLADFWWIPALGLEATVLAAASMNLVVSAVALCVSNWAGEGKSSTNAVSAEAASSQDLAFTNWELRLAILGIGISGFVAMLYEVAWTRMLALALGSSTHAFSLMLITFITGIALGAWIVGRWKKLRRILEAFAWAEVALGLAVFVSMFFYELLPYWFVKLATMLTRQEATYPIYEALQAGLCFAVMFIPTLCLGMTLPLVSRIATAELARTGRSVGAVFSVNTLGTVVGAAVTGLWLMPAVGLARTFAVGVAMNIAVGLVILGRNHTAFRRALPIAIPVLALGFIGFADAKFDDAWRYALSVGLWRAAGVPPDVAAFRTRATAEKYYRDGAGATVSVGGWRVGNTDHLVLKVNGKPDASTADDLVTQLLLGHIPLLLKPGAQQALVIGLGSGMTCGAVMCHPSIEHLDAVEISPEVVEAARLFRAHNNNVLTNARVRVLGEDAKSFLQITDRRYDVIISEPSNPWMAGVAGVFSREYYESCRAHLTQGGLMTQWIHSYEASNESLEIVLATFKSVFPYFGVWQGTLGDLILVGSTQPLGADLDELQKRFQVPAVRADLERIDIFRVPVLLARELISPANAPFVPRNNVPVHSDFYPVLEYVAQTAFFLRGQANLCSQFDETLAPRPMTLLARYLAKHQLSEMDLKAFALFNSERPATEPPFVRSILQRWQNEVPEATAPAELAAKLPNPNSVAELESLRIAKYREQIFKGTGPELELLRFYGKFLLQAYRGQRSVVYLPPITELQAVLDRLSEADQPNWRIYQLALAELAWDRGDDVVCSQLARRALAPGTNAADRVNLSLEPRLAAQVMARMAESLWRGRKIAEAWAVCQEAERSGFLTQQSALSDPSLDLVYRKIESEMTASADARKN